MADTTKDPILDLTDEEILDIVAKEQARLGEHLAGWTLTYFTAETKHFLELHSEINKEYQKHLWKTCNTLVVGKIFPIGEAPVYPLDNLDEVLKTGKEVYFRLRKQIPGLHRDLKRAYAYD